MTMTLEALEALADGGSQEGGEDQRCDFQADDLTATITNSSGDVLATIAMPARAFKPKKDRSGQLKGGVGWYGSVQSEDGVMFGKVPLSGQVRLSVAKLKFGPDDKVDLTTTDDEE